MSKDADPRSRRKDPRASCSWKVRVVNAQKKQFKGKVVNVSLGGVMLETDSAFSIGENLYMEIQATHQNKNQVIVVVGEVTYAALGKGGHHQIGLKFATDTSKFRNFLREYVADKAI
ncbi:MAG: PilZ domain-containing protein [Pseudomonadales bacterium]|nr:PilZ domain-containing protein [Pseudomonadales bacterium]